MFLISFVCLALCFCFSLNPSILLGSRYYSLFYTWGNWGQRGSCWESCNYRVVKLRLWTGSMRFFFHTRETQKLAWEGIKIEVVSISKSKMWYCHVGHIIIKHWKYYSFIKKLSNYPYWKCTFPAWTLKIYVL